MQVPGGVGQCNDIGQGPAVQRDVGAASIGRIEDATEVSVREHLRPGLQWMPRRMDLRRFLRRAAGRISDGQVRVGWGSQQGRELRFAGGGAGQE